MNSFSARQPIALLVAFVAGLLFLAIQTESAAAQTNTSCSGWSSRGSSDDTNSSCAFTPSTLSFGIYQLGLCTEAPTDYVEAQTSCSFFFNSTSSQLTMDVQNGVSSPLVNEINIPADTYTHAVMLLDAGFQITGTTQMSENQYGANGTAGSYCYTNGNTAPINQTPATTPKNATSRNISCAASQGAATAAAQATDLRVSNLNGSNELTFPKPSVPAEFTAQLYDNVSSLENGIKSVVTPTTYDDASFNDSGAQFIYVVQTLNDPVDFTSGTTGMDIAIKVSNALKIDSYYTISSDETDGAGEWCNGGIDPGSDNFSCLGNAILQYFEIVITSR